MKIESKEKAIEMQDHQSCMNVIRKSLRSRESLSSEQNNNGSNGNGSVNGDLRRNSEPIYSRDQKMSVQFQEKNLVVIKPVEYENI